MIELKHKELQGYEFIQSFKKLANTPHLNYKTIYSVKKLTESIEKEAKLSQEIRKSIVAKHAEKNEDGSIKEKEGHPGQAEVLAENQEALSKEMAEFMESTVSLGREKIVLTPGEIDSAALTAIDVMALDSLVDLPDLDAPIAEVIPLKQ